MTLPNKKPSLFGISKLTVFKQLTDVAGSAPTYEAGIVIPGVKSLTYNRQPNKITAKGDEKITEVEYVDDESNVGFSSVYFPFAAAEMINGGEVVDGTDDSTYHGPGADETGEYFKIEALSKNKKTKLIIHKVKGRLNIGGMTGGEFVDAAFEGTAIDTIGTPTDAIGPRRDSVMQSTVALT